MNDVRRVGAARRSCRRSSASPPRTSCRPPRSTWSSTSLQQPADQRPLHRRLATPNSASRSGSTSSAAASSTSGELAAAGRRGRAGRRDLEPGDLREGDRGRRTTTRPISQATAHGRRHLDAKAVYEGSRSRTSRTRPTCCGRSTTRRKRARRLREPRGLARPRARHRRARSPRRAASGGGRRPNVMIKVPGHADGHPRDPRQLIAEASTSTSRCSSRATTYEQVAEAYIAGLEALATRGRRRGARRERRELLRQPHRHADRRDARRSGSRPRRDAEEERARAGLLGKVAIANAKLAYQRLPAALRRAALGGARRQGRADAARCCGQHRHEEPAVQRRPLRRGADRAATPSTRCRRRRSTRSATTAAARRALDEDVDEARETMLDASRGRHLARRRSPTSCSPTA